MKPLGLIVAGGKSERFGSPKILHDWEGIPQWKRLFHALQPHCSKIILNIPAHQKELFPPDVPFDFLLEEEQNGPLVGLCKAFELHPNQHWLVVASDHFWVEAATFADLIPTKSSSFFMDENGQIYPWLGKISKEDVEEIVKSKNQGEISLFRILKQIPLQKILPRKLEWILDGDFSDKIQLLHPTKSAIKLDLFKYILFKHFILRTLKNEGPLTFTQLQKFAVEELNQQIKGSIPWYLVSVKLDLEARGLIARIPKTKPTKVELVSFV